ncbi:MAG: ribosome silencing factor [Thermincola sp.]|nr:ribosome silencing factor [Thermincola sp.]MDT3704340.1 ribosome silencing factor [Thermincola sp.]
MTLLPEQVASLAAAAAEDKKARDVIILDIHAISVICDFFVICSGLSSTQVKAVAENVEEQLEKHGIQKLRIEGFKEARWILLDYGSVVVHVFQERDREFYNLEHLWGDAKVVHL